MGLWKSKNPAPPTKRSILKSTKGKPAKVAFHIENRVEKRRPSSIPNISKRKSSSSRKDIKTDAKTGPSQVCFNEDVKDVEIIPTVTVTNQCRKSNKSISCRSNGEDNDKPRLQSAIHMEDDLELPKINHRKKSSLEDKTHSIYTWLEQSEKALKNCSSSSRQSLERALTAITERKARTQLRTPNESVNRAEIRTESPISKKLSPRRTKGKSEHKSVYPQVIQTRKESIDMDKVIKQRIFNALDKREVRFGTRRHSTPKKTAPKEDQTIYFPEVSPPRASPRRSKAKYPSSKILVDKDKSRKTLDVEKISTRKSRKDRPSHSRDIPPSSSESDTKIRRSSSRRSRKKKKKSRSRKRRSKTRSKSRAGRSSSSERNVAIKTKSTKKKRLKTIESEVQAVEDVEKHQLEDSALSSEDVPESPSVTDLRQVPVYIAQLCVAPDFERKPHSISKMPSMNPQGDWIQSIVNLYDKKQGNLETRTDVQSRGDELARLNDIDCSTMKCNLIKSIQKSLKLPGIPSRESFPKHNLPVRKVSLHRAKNAMDLTDGRKLLRRSKPSTSLVEKPPRMLTGNSLPNPVIIEQTGGEIVQLPPVKTSKYAQLDAASSIVKSKFSVQLGSATLDNCLEEKDAPVEHNKIDLTIREIKASVASNNTSKAEAADIDKVPENIIKTASDLLKDKNDYENPMLLQQSESGGDFEIPTSKSTKSLPKHFAEPQKSTSQNQPEELPNKQSRGSADLPTNQSKPIEHMCKYNKVPGGFAKETRIPTKTQPPEKSGKKKSRKKKSRSKSKGHLKRKGVNPKEATLRESDVPPDRKKAYSDKSNKHSGGPTGEANSKSHSSSKKQGSSEQNPKNGSKSSGMTSKEYTGTEETSETNKYPSSDEISSFSETSTDEDSGDEDPTASSVSSYYSGSSPYSNNYTKTKTSGKSDKGIPECTTTEVGGICFKLPGRVTHKTTIKVAHFPRSDPICINIPPNPCGCPEGCNCWNPCYPPCCPPRQGCYSGAAGAGGAGGKLMNNCNIYNGPSPNNANKARNGQRQDRGRRGMSRDRSIHYSRFPGDYC